MKLAILFALLLPFSTALPSSPARTVRALCSLILLSSRLPKTKLIPPQYPGDPNYPSIQQWQVLNASLGGKLIAGQRAAHVCYQNAPDFDPVKCNETITSLQDPNFVSDQPVDVMWPFWYGNLCPAIMNASGSCGLGNYSNYVVAAENAQDVSLGV